MQRPSGNFEPAPCLSARQCFLSAYRVSSLRRFISDLLFLSQVRPTRRQVGPGRLIARSWRPHGQCCGIRTARSLLRRKLIHISGNRVLLRCMQFCDECRSIMHTEGDLWTCRSCENQEPRDSQAEAAMTTQDGQRHDVAPAVADATQGSTEAMSPARWTTVTATGPTME